MFQRLSGGIDILIERHDVRFLRMPLEPFIKRLVDNAMPLLWRHVICKILSDDFMRYLDLLGRGLHLGNKPFSFRASARGIRLQ